MENISGDDDIQMKNRPHGHVITCSCDVSDSYRCRLKALFNIKPPKQEKPFGGNLVSAGTVWISLDEECGSIKSSGVTYQIYSCPVGCENGETCFTWDSRKCGWLCRLQPKWSSSRCCCTSRSIPTNAFKSFSFLQFKTKQNVKPLNKRTGASLLTHTLLDHMQGNFQLHKCKPSALVMNRDDYTSS